MDSTIVGKRSYRVYEILSPYSKTFFPFTFRDKASSYACDPQRIGTFITLLHAARLYRCKDGCNPTLFFCKLRLLEDIFRKKKRVAIFKYGPGQRNSRFDNRNQSTRAST